MLYFQYVTIISFLIGLFGVALPVSDELSNEIDYELLLPYSPSCGCDFFKKSDHGALTIIPAIFAEALGYESDGLVDFIVERLQPILEKNKHEKSYYIVVDMILHSLASYLFMARPFREGFIIVQGIFDRIPVLFDRVCHDFAEAKLYKKLPVYQVFFLKLLKQAGVLERFFVVGTKKNDCDYEFLLEYVDEFIVYSSLLLARKKKNPGNSIVQALKSLSHQDAVQVDAILRCHYLTCFINDDPCKIDGIGSNEDVLMLLNSYKVLDVSYLAVAAFAGCEDIFSYFLHNGYTIEKDVLEYAVMGGDCDIVDICLANLGHVTYGVDRIDHNLVMRALAWHRELMAYHLWEKRYPGTPFLSNINQALMIGNASWLAHCLEKEKNTFKTTFACKVILNGVGNASFLSYFYPEILLGMGVDDSHELSDVMKLTHRLDLTHVDGDGNTLLHKAIIEENTLLVANLIRKGIDINVQNNRGESALHTAVVKGNSAAIQELLKSGAHVWLKDYDGFTPLHYAALVSNNSIIKQLLSVAGYKKEIAHMRKDSPLFLRENQASYYSLLQSIIYHKNCEEYKKKHEKIKEGEMSESFARLSYNSTLCAGTPLRIAAYNNNVEGVRLMLDSGASIEEKSSGMSLFEYAIFQGCEEVAIYLVEQGVNIHQRYAKNNTALHRACSSNLYGLVQRLVDRGLDVNSENDRQETPIFENLSSYPQKIHFDILSFLVEHGALLNHYNKKGRTPLMCEVHNLCDDRVRSNPFYLHMHEKAFSYLLAHGASIQSLYKSGINYLINLQMVMFLHAQGFDFLAADATNEPILFSLFEHYEKIQDDFFFIIDFLVKNNINIRAINSKGQTLLHLFAQKPCIDEVIKKLLAYGASKEILDVYGMRPADYAGLERIKLLLQ